MNVFIVENSMIAREALQSALSDMSDVKVVGYAVDEPNAIKRIGALQPDVVILDLGLQSGSGIGVLENIKKCHTTIKVIVFTHYTDDFCVDRCKSAGADYFFDKSFQFTQLREVLWKWTHTDRLDNRFRPGNKLDALQ
ncbi:MAG: response regulator transcription factor [Betaproteobacteria bacterium]|nr:response regulator transcription factor [Betaproteobacteria bacterium]